jgi:hypothetical protein
MGASSVPHICCRITEVAYNSFYDTLQTQSRNLPNASLVCPFTFIRLSSFSFKQDLDDPSVMPPISILDHGQVLREIMTVYQSSLLGDEDLATQTAGFERILDIMVDPAVDMCRTVGEEKKRLKPAWDMEVFILNCLSHLLVRNSNVCECSLLND